MKEHFATPLCEEAKKLEAEFQSCQRLLTAVGDENRQHLLCVMLSCPCSRAYKNDAPFSTGGITPYADIKRRRTCEITQGRYLCLLLSRSGQKSGRIACIACAKDGKNHDAASGQKRTINKRCSAVMQCSPK